MGIIRLTFGGRLVGAQRWSFGVTMNGLGTTPTSAALGTYAEQARADFNSTVWSATTQPYRTTFVTAATNFDVVKAYYKATSSTPATVVGQSTGAAVAGGVTGSGTPPQLALVVSLRDGLAGRAHRGRCYLPTSSVLLSTSTLLLADATALDVATKFANFLSLLRTRTIGGELLYPVVSSLTAPNAIVTCSVDTVVDTQRRRRDKLVGTYSSANLIVG